MPAVERTILDIEARILHRAGMRYEEFSRTYDAADGKAKLREVVNDTQQRLGGYREWPWLIKQATLTGTGTQIISLPQDFNQEMRIIDTSATRPVPVIPYTSFLDSYGWLSSTVGFPLVAAFPDQSHVAMYPSMTTGNTVTLWYLREMPEMVNDNDVPDVPSSIEASYNRCLIEGSLIDVYEYAENPKMASRQETEKYPVSLKELVRIAGAGYSSIMVRESGVGSTNPYLATPFYGSNYPNYRYY